jgi:hypothetical protein
MKYIENPAPLACSLIPSPSPSPFPSPPLPGWNMTPEEEAIFEKAQALRRDAAQVCKIKIK